MKKDAPITGNFRTKTNADTTNASRFIVIIAPTVETSSSPSTYFCKLLKIFSSIKYIFNK